MTMHIKMNRIAPLVAAGAAALAIAAAPTAAATTGGGRVHRAPEPRAMSRSPLGPARPHNTPSQLQQPFGGDTGALLFHH